MMSALKWFLMAGGAIGLGATWAWMKAQIQQPSEPVSVPPGMKVAAGLATGLGLFELIRQSVFVWVAFAVGSVIWALDISIPEAKKFLSEYPQLYFIVPYFVGAGCSGISTGQAVKQVVGSMLVVCGVGILGYSVIQYVRWEAVHVINVPANEKSVEFFLDADDVARWKIDDMKQIALFDIATKDWVFQCSNNPWLSVRTPTSRRFYFHSCRPTSSSVRVTITH